MAGVSKKLGFFLILFSIVFGHAAHVYAATLSVSPPYAEYAVGQTIAVTILLTTPEQSANAVSVQLHFPADKLQVVTVSKAGSIIELWAVEPKFSNRSGVLNFEGVIPHPGFQSSNGRLLTVYFEATDAGTAPIIITGGTVLANDGQGSEILQSLGNAEYIIENPPPKKIQAPVRPVPKASSVPEAIPIPTVTPTPTPPPYIEPSIEPVVTVVSVEKPSIWNEIMFRTLLLSLLIILTILIIYLAYRMHTLKRQIRLDIVKFDLDFQRAFHILRDDISDHVDVLENTRTSRSLTPEEQKFIAYFRHNVRDIQIFLANLIKAIKNRLR